MTRFLIAAGVALALTASPVQAKPAGCPSLWCGCYMALKKGYSLAQAKALGLFKARTWGVVFRRVPLAPGTVAVFARGRGTGGHVGEVVQVDGDRVLLHSGNDGKTVKTRWRSLRGLITAVDPRSPRRAVEVRTGRQKATRTARARTGGKRQVPVAPIRVALHSPA